MMGRIRVSVLLVLVLCATAVVAQDLGQRASLQQALADRYRVTVVGATPWKMHSSDNDIKRAGGVVVIRKAGLYGSTNRTTLAMWGIRDDKPPELMAGQKDQAIKVGEKFYVNSVYVGSDVVSIGLLSVGLIPTQTKAAQLWTSLAFFLPKDLLARGDITAVYQAIDPWLLPEGSFERGYTAGAAAPQPVVPAAPADLQPGMTRSEIEAKLGPPVKEASFGTKTWLTYGGLVAVLENGKLASVDQSAQPPAKITVSSEPAGADVYVDGNFVGSTPSVLPLPAGSYKIEVKSSGYKDWSRSIKALPGGEVSLKASLEK
jgi:hypothetical protein